MEELSSKVCQLDDIGNNKHECSIRTGSHRSLCYACHEEKFCATMMLVSLYQIIFGLIGMVSDCGFRSKLFGFTRSKIGRSLLMIFIGSFATALGNEYRAQKLTFASGIVSLSLGFVELCYYTCIGSDIEGDHYITEEKSNLSNFLIQPTVGNSNNNTSDFMSTSANQTRLYNRDVNSTESREHDSSSTFGQDNFFSSVQNQQRYWSDRDNQQPIPRGESSSSGSGAFSFTGSESRPHENKSQYTSLRDQ